MVDSIGINRVPTNEEMQDYNQLGGVSPKNRFLKELATVEMSFVKEYKPFDAQCAKLDFADKIEKIERESQRKYGYVRASDVIRMKFDDLERYGDMKRFELVSDDEVLEFQNINQTKTAVATGRNMSYVCKDRGHGVCVFVPMVVYEERFVKKKAVKEE